MALRARYNEWYVLRGDTGGQVPKVEVFGENFISRPDPGGARPDPEQCKKAAIKREQSHACMNSAEREQARCEASM